MTVATPSATAKSKCAQSSVSGTDARNRVVMPIGLLVALRTVHPGACPAADDRHRDATGSPAISGRGTPPRATRTARARVTFASTSSGAAPGPSTQAPTTARSSGPRTVTASNPKPRATAARSVGREADGVQRRAVRAEVVHLRAVGLVVVHDHDHGQAQPDDRLQLRGPHEGAAVAQRGHRQPVGSGQRRADGAGQAQPDGLEGLGEAEPELVRDAEEHARIAHEVARVDGDGPLGREQVVEGDGERPRIDPARRSTAARRARPASGRGGDGSPDPLGAVSLGLARAAPS